VTGLPGTTSQAREALHRRSADCATAAKAAFVVRLIGEIIRRRPNRRNEGRAKALARGQAAVDNEFGAGNKTRLVG
jgi:hypothetical protein